MTTNRNLEMFDESEGVAVEEAKKKYSSTVVDHFTNPRNWGTLENYDCYTYMSGTCGDTVGVYVGLKGDRIDRMGFVTNGCGPTIACGSALTCLAKNLTVSEAKSLSSQKLIAHLDGLPAEKAHCADFVLSTLRGALEKLE
ncbi:MAG: iron-sulfur cluster assembly scaffold protein [Desulfomonile tiedjei]|uniref:Iron-sulfur cluster assembly scaffold protein n=1 Tax=Desulfomonile tiedjei TaxID=2358 RepID=A0A9D6V165_9BACT|nr:iron-sulfur cluster assembly scaffold protein [Desulfomonile tiedjei]